LPARTFGELADGSPVEDEPTSALEKQDGNWNQLPCLTFGFARDLWIHGLVNSAIDQFV
jgi:hypothetical protein